MEKRILEESPVNGSLPSAVVTVNAQGVVDGWNEGAERIYGYAANEMVGQPMETAAVRLVPAELIEEFHRVMRAASLGRAGPRFQTLRIHKDGRRILVTHNVLPIIDAGGDVVGFSFVCDEVRPKAQG